MRRLVAELREPDRRPRQHPVIGNRPKRPDVSASETDIGIGHNQGPPGSLAGSWTGYCWTRAKRQAAGNPPVEMIRIRARRAKELGLTYAQYAAILRDRGYTEALVFDLTETPRTKAPIEAMARKLRELRRCTLLAAVDGTGTLLDDLNARTGGLITDWPIYPALLAQKREDGRTTPQMPTAETVLNPILEMLERHLIGPSQAILIGDGLRARRIDQTARLARVFPHGVYFG